MTDRPVPSPVAAQAGMQAFDEPFPEILCTFGHGLDISCRKLGKNDQEDSDAPCQNHRISHLERSYLDKGCRRRQSFAVLGMSRGIPPSEFTLEAGDDVSITIGGIGTLTNPVIRLGA